jgi:hypothetical protein
MLTFDATKDATNPSCCIRDGMRKIKRVSIELRHREVTIAVGGATLHVQKSEPDATNAPAFCPTCGGPWITLDARVEGETALNPDLVHSALEQSGLHLQISPAGQLRICQRSFEEIKEKF